MLQTETPSVENLDFCRKKKNNSFPLLDSNGNDDKLTMDP
jgi:hypothetical protein